MLVDDRQECQLALGGQGRFRFVEDVQALAPEPMRRKGEERLAVGLLVKRDAAEPIDDRSAARFLVKALDLGGDVEATLCAQEEAVARSTESRPASSGSIQL